MERWTGAALARFSLNGRTSPSGVCTRELLPCLAFCHFFFGWVTLGRVRSTRSTRGRRPWKIWMLGLQTTLPERAHLCSTGQARSATTFERTWRLWSRKYSCGRLPWTAGNDFSKVLLVTLYGNYPGHLLFRTCVRRLPSAFASVSGPRATDQNKAFVAQAFAESEDAARFTRVFWKLQVLLLPAVPHLDHARWILT